MAMRGVFITKQFDLPVYKLLQALRVTHGDLSQWEILQASLVCFAAQPRSIRDECLAMIHKAPSDQPVGYAIAHE